MRIAVVDVAAQDSGALSVLNDFVATLVAQETDSEDEWFILTSVVRVPEATNIHNIQFPWIKKSWFHRLWWEYFVFRRWIRESNIDVVFSLQNNGLPVKNVKQVVYLHNVLLIQNSCKFSFLSRAERMLAVYSRILGPYTRRSWKHADMLVVQGDSVKKQVSRFYSEDRIYICAMNPNIDFDVKPAQKSKGFIYPAKALSYKNFELIIDAVKRMELNGEEPEVLFTITGDENAYARKIRKKAEGVKGIKFIGYQDRKLLLEKYREYGLIITSRLESCPVPLWEAMKCGTVIVALRLGYVIDFANAACYNKLHIAEDDVESLAMKMREALLDEKEGESAVDNEHTGAKKLINTVKKLGNI